jgi:ABC-type multidrug transport system fused ATPase/permease subunit
MSREKAESGERRSFTRSQLGSLGRALAVTKPYRVKFSIGLLALVMSSVLLLSFPYLFGIMVNVAGGKQTAFGLTVHQVALALVAVLIIQVALSYVRVYTFAQVSERSFADLRKHLFEKLVWQPMRFYDEHRIGEFMSRISADVATVQEMVSFTLAEFIRQVLTLIVGIVVIFLITPKLTVFMLLTLPLLIVLALVFGRKIRRLSKKTQDQLADVTTVAEESFQSITVVKAFANEWLQSQRYAQGLASLVQSAVRTARYRGLFVSLILFILFGGMVAVGWYGATLIQSDELDSGVLLSFILYTAFIGGSIAGLGEIYTQLQRSAGASERIFEWLDLDDERPGAEAVTGALQVIGHVEFSDVCFSYPSRQDVQVLKDATFTIQPGQKIALVGKSGSGKSTLINLLLRFYQPESGVICVDNREINTFELRSYRQQFGIVPQEVVLFGGSIRENIAYGKPNATVDEIWAAAEKANASEFIHQLPEGLDTLVGNRGTKLSGGQRQRVAIARAILRDPAILILDEATSALDAQSEWLVQQALDHLMEGRTTFIIAHRLSTIKRADMILVVQGGAIIERGTHEELLARAGTYAGLLRLQLQQSGLKHKETEIPDRF